MGKLGFGREIVVFSSAEREFRNDLLCIQFLVAVIVELVEKIESGVKGGECIPMNFNNGGFVFDYNPALSSLVTDEMRSAVDEAIAEFTAQAGVLSNWADVQL